MAYDAEHRYHSENVKSQMILTSIYVVKYYMYPSVLCVIVARNSNEFRIVLETSAREPKVNTTRARTNHVNSTNWFPAPCWHCVSSLSLRPTWKDMAPATTRWEHRTTSVSSTCSQFSTSRSLQSWDWDKSDNNNLCVLIPICEITFLRKLASE